MNPLDLRLRTFFHSFADVPMDEGALGVHQVELVVQASPCLGDGSSVGEHAHGARNLRQIASRDDGGRLVVDADLDSKLISSNVLIA